MTTAIIGVGNLGGTVARNLVAGDEPVVLAAADKAHAEALADELGPNASAASVEDAIAGADVVVLATWLDQTRELVPMKPACSRTRSSSTPRTRSGSTRTGRCSGRCRKDSRPAQWLPAFSRRARTTSRRSALSAPASSSRPARNHEPRIVLFYATDDDTAEATAQRLIRAAGFEPLKVGGLSDPGRMEGPDGELQGRIFDLDEARATIATKGVKT